MAGTAGRQVTRARASGRLRQTAVPRAVAPPESRVAVAEEPEREAAPEGSFAAVMERAQQQILAVTYWFDPAPRPEPYAATIRFIGRRVGIEGKEQARDSFMQEEVIDRVVPGSGPLAVTAKVDGINPGEWEVKASVVATSPRAKDAKDRASAEHSHATLGPLTRLWQRWAPPADGTIHVKTCSTPFAHVAGTLPLVWISLVVTGMIEALVMQGVMLSHEHVQAGPVTLLTVAALLIGAVVSKVWFIVKHRATHRAEGWTIQGLVVGAGASAALLFALAHAPTGLVLDASAPGLGFGIAIGRVGCFLAGCCGGPPTAARWGIWSSDQRVGARRVPTQLMESASTLLLGLLALVGILTRGLVGGAYFVAVVTAYVVIREGLLRLRAERQPARSRVPVASIVAALALIVSLVFIVRG